MGSMIGGISGMAMNTVGTIFGAVAGMKADKKLSKLLNENPSYTQSPYAKERYDLAKTLLNSRMAGATKIRKLYLHTEQFPLILYWTLGNVPAVS